MSGKRILVVDDSRVVREQLTRFLSGNGFDVVAACDGEEGLREAAAVDADLVITDINMPHTDGFGLVSGLRAMENYAKRPIFVLTTESSGDVARRGREVGATAWIVKPFRPDVLLMAIKKVLSC